jgi:hypothetical protein
MARPLAWGREPAGAGSAARLIDAVLTETTTDEEDV